MKNQEKHMCVDKQVEALSKYIEQLESEISELQNKQTHKDYRLSDDKRSCANFSAFSLDELENVFDPIFKNIRDAALVLDAGSSEIFLFNKKACEIYGFNESEFRRKRFHEISSVIRRQGDWSIFISDLQKARTLIIEGRECQQNGHIFPVEISTSYIGENGLDYIIVFIRDIYDIRKMPELESQVKKVLDDKVQEQTAGLRKINELLRLEVIERKKIEQALREKEQHLNSIINVIPNLIAYIDKNEFYQFNNKEYERCFNRPVNEIQGRSVEQILGEKRYSVIKDYISDALSGNEVIFEEQIKSKTGDLMWMREHYYPDFDDTGQTSGFISMVTDISKEKVRQEEDKIRLIEHFHLARLGTIGEMATEIAHELNQPLCAITNYSEASLRMLELETGSTQDISEALAEISVQGNRAGKIIERLRNFAQRHEPKYVQIDINAVIGEAIHIARLDSSWESIDLTFKADKNHSQINADNLLIQQVIINLIRNARDAINSLPTPRGKITINTENISDDYIIVMVRDSAGLLPDEDSVKIFQPFYSTKHDGLGMGLAISNTIVQLHGGKMWAESLRESATVVQFTLPVIRRNKSCDDS